MFLIVTAPLNPLPPLPPPVGNKSGQAFIAPQLAVPTNHKCYRRGTCFHAMYSATELDIPIFALGNDSVCHDCYEITEQIQLLS